MDDPRRSVHGWRILAVPDANPARWIAVPAHARRVARMVVHARVRHDPVRVALPHETLILAQNQHKSPGPEPSFGQVILMSAWPLLLSPNDRCGLHNGSGLR
jgi:hypothetical protein